MSEPRPASPISVHGRAVLTWLAIFPLVTTGLYALDPIAAGWPLWFRALVLTVVVVPLSVYLVVPQLVRACGAVARRRARRVADVRLSRETGTVSL